MHWIGVDMELDRLHTDAEELADRWLEAHGKLKRGEMDEAASEVERKAILKEAEELGLLVEVVELVCVEWVFKGEEA